MNKRRGRPADLGSASLAAVVLLALALLTGCAPAVSSPKPTSGQAAPSPLAAHVIPVGAIAAVDAASWALVERMTAPLYTADTTAAVVEGLARSGIGTYDDASSAAPALALTGLASPFSLLSFQAHALAVGAWADSDFTGAELDTVVPLPPDLTGVPTTSQLIAAYVATADSPGGNLSRALMAGQDLLAPARLHIPAIVLVLFASDVATDGGRIAAPAPTLSAAAQGNLLLSGTAVGLNPDRSGIELAVSTGICSQTANWISGAIASLFNAIKVATPAGGVGRIIAGVWNWLVGVGQAFVQNLISSVTDVVLGTIRSIAETIAGVAEQIASLLPQAVSVRASSATGGGATFFLGPDPLTGTFTVTVTAGDLPDWPAVLSDCAQTAGVALPDFHPNAVPLIWGPLEAPANPLLSTTGSDPMTDANGLANWGFVTSVDPGDPRGEQRNQIDYLPVAVHRPELDTARQRLSNVLLGSIPDLLRPYVAAIFAPYLDGLQARLNALLDAHGRGVAVIVFHDQAPSPPPPTPKPTPTPCETSGGVVGPGAYSGTMTETIHRDATSGTIHDVADGSGQGPISFRVAPNGSISGSWSFSESVVYTSTSPGDVTVVHVTGAVTNGQIAGTVSAVAQSANFEETELVSVNGVSGNLSTVDVPWPALSQGSLALVPGCNGGASLQHVISGFFSGLVRIDVARTGP
jgi:hypothetical protein